MFWFVAFVSVLAIAEANPEPGLLSFLGSLFGITDECTVQATTNYTDDIYCGDKPKCFAEDQYRTFDGSCNNLDNSWWAMADTPYKRLFPNNYADGVHEFPKSKKKKNLPNCREVSMKVYSTKQKDDPIWTLVFMQYGQLIAHDMGLTAGVGQTATVIECCSKGQYTDIAKTDPRCANIEIPKNDRINKGRVCINFYRTETTKDRDNCKNTYKVAEQITAVTGYMDSSYIYGSKEETAKYLREGKCGRLKSVTRNGKEVLPQDDEPTKTCAVKKDTQPCYKAGDVRVNQNPQLALLQIIYLKHHNYIADKLCKLNPQWSDETAYQETRRIVIAVHQHIFYYEILPFLIGPLKAAELKLVYLTERGYVNDYDPKINAAASNEFSTAAFRFFHTAIQGELDLYNKSKKTGSIRLDEWFDKPEVAESKYEELSTGIWTQPQNDEDTCIVKDVRDYLFKDDEGKGQDLKAIDCQRGRDHGLATYPQALEACCLGKIKSFKDYEKYIDKKDVDTLRSLYDSYEDVDLGVGLYLEQTSLGALSGPLAACIIGEQFVRTRRGDRFFYENNQNPCPFTIDQLNEIRDTANLASLLCQVEGIEEIQRKAFIQIGLLNPAVSCKQIKQLDLSLWKTDSEKGCAKE